VRRARYALALVALLGACAPIPLPRQSTFHPSDVDLAVTRIVHESFVLELHGTRLLVDPWFHSTWVTRQHEPLGLTPATLPQVAAVLLTGDDVTRFDPDALHDLAGTTPRAVVPPALRERVLGLGFRDVTGLAWWEKTDVDGVTITAVPTSAGPRENGYVVVSHDARLYLAGDTRPFGDLVDVATAFPHLDVAVLPIGGRRHFGMAQQMTPEQAADAAALLKPARAIPSGYGATSGSPFVSFPDDPVGAFRKAMEQKGLGNRVLVLEPGESWHYAKP
jgi:L-ascorbate metabolism protein UlaG (beta-lactamase superfamily)